MLHLAVVLARLLVLLLVVHAANPHGAAVLLRDAGSGRERGLLAPSSRSNLFHCTG